MTPEKRAERALRIAARIKRLTEVLIPRAEENNSKNLDELKEDLEMRLLQLKLLESGRDA